MFVMFTYDVAADRTHLFRKLLRRFLGHEQFSVFYGDLVGSKLEKLRLELRALVTDGDRIAEFTVENRNNIDILVWSKDGRVEGVAERAEDARHKANSVVL